MIFTAPDIRILMRDYAGLPYLHLIVDPNDYTQHTFLIENQTLSSLCC